MQLLYLIRTFPEIAEIFDGIVWLATSNYAVIDNVQ